MRIRWMLVSLIALSALIYLPFLTSPFIWDDEQFIFKNQYVTSFNVPKLFTTNTTAGAGLVDNYYRPLTSLSLALDWQFWLLNTIGYHLTNFLLHTAAALVLFVFLRTIKVPKNWSFLLALLFTVHPVQTESVMYINSRGDSLYTLFLLLGLLFFAKILTGQKFEGHFYEQKITINQWWLAILSILCFTCAIFAKEIALAGLGLYFLVFFTVKLSRRHGIIGKTRYPESLPRHPELVSGSSKSIERHAAPPTRRAEVCTLAGIVLVTLTYLFLRATSLNFTRGTQPAVIDPTYAQSLPIRLLTFSRATTEYALILTAPLSSHMEHTLPLVTNLVSPFPWLLLITIIGITLLGYIEWKSRRTLWIGFGTSWFFIMLVPVSGIVPINGLLYEHWLYLPQVGFFLCLLGVLRLSRLGTKLDRYPLVKPTLIFLIVITLIFLSLLQNYRWADPVRFYTYTLQFTETARLHNNLAMSLAEQGKIEAAIPHYQRAIELSNEYPQTFHNLGNAYRELGDTQQAISNYEQALQLDPGFFHTYQPLLVLYIQTKQKVKALSLLETIKQHMTLDPERETEWRLTIDQIQE